jgi:secreted PhoX family phosphatase
MLTGFSEVIDMIDKHNCPLSADDWDEINFPRPTESDFDRVLEATLTRRGFLSGALAFGSAAAVMGTGLLIPSAAEADDHVMASRFPFKPIDIQTDGTVHVPEGYHWSVMASWGDPMFSDADGYDITEGGALALSDRVFGENTDGMETFSYQGHQLLVVNHEYTNRETNLPAAQEGVPANADDVLKLQNLQGVSKRCMHKNKL